MKKTVAIALLIVHLFNAGGYMLLFQYLIHRSNSFEEQQISKGLYNVHDLVEIKIPAHMPQVQDWPEYEPLYGQVQLQGDSYNYVKLRVTHNAIYIMCVPNYSTTRLANANVIYARQVSDVPLNKKGNTNAVKTFSFNTYYHLTASYTAVQSLVIVDQVLNPASTGDILHVFLDTIDQPPRAAC